VSTRTIADGSPKQMLDPNPGPPLSFQAFLRREPVQDGGTHDMVVHE
jgi:hypothetical protein